MMSEKHRKKEQGRQCRLRQPQLASPSVVGASSVHRQAIAWLVITMVVRGGVSVSSSQRGFSAKDANTARYDQVSNQSAEKISGAAKAPDNPIATLKAEQLALARTLMHEFPNSEMPVVLMGHVHEGTGNNDRAIEFWHKALAMNPQRPDVCNSIATIEMGRGQYEEAIKFWRKALEMVPSTPKLRSDVALALMVLGRQQEAIVELERELEINAKSDLAHFLLGKACLQQQAYEKAKTHFESALRLQPRDSGAYYGLVTVCRRLGQQAEAAQYAAMFKKLKADEHETEKAADKRYDDTIITRRRLADIFVQAGEIYLTAGQLDKAEALLKRAMKCSSGNRTYMMMLASFYKTSERFSEALALYKALAAIEPTNAECTSNIRSLSVKLKQIGVAEAAFSKAVASAPTSSSPYRTLARFYLEKRMKLPRARGLVQKAVALEPTAPNYIVLGWACDSQGDKKGAMAATRRAVELEPNNQDYQRVYEYFKQQK